MGKPVEHFSKRIEIRDKIIGEDSPPYIIAEMACAHQGDLNRAKAIVDASVEAKADAVQFELVDPDDNIVPQTEMYKLLKRLYFTPDQWRDLFEYTRSHDIAVFSYAYDYVSLLLALKLGTDAIKLNSSDLSHPDMIVKSAESSLPVSIGTGASTMEEITESLELARSHGGEKIILMQGVQNFPTDHKFAHIRRIKLLRSAFDCLVGYADHTDAFDPLSRVIDLAALGMDAVIIEKHITLDRSQKDIDHEAALEPGEFKTFVRTIRDAHIALGPPHLQGFKENDHRYRLFQKKSIVAAKPIAKGEKITREIIAFLRNSDTPGMSPMKFNSLLGKTAKREIDRFDQIQQADVED